MENSKLLEPAYLTFNNYEKYNKFQIITYFKRLMIENGVLVSLSHNICYAHNDNNFNVNVDKSTKNQLISQNMLAPPEREDDVITLPPISGGGDVEPIETTPPTFGTSDRQSDQIPGTESGIPFINVISNIIE